MNKRQLFLASASERRKQILTQHCIPYSVIPNRLNNEALNPTLPIRLAIRILALEKAIASQQNYQGLILGVDTIVYCDNKILCKPKSINQAKQSLEFLSAKSHHVISGIALLDTLTHRTITRSVVTTVTFKHISNEEIDYYTSHYQVLDKAGAYAIQEYAGRFVSKRNGSYENIVGLPIQALKKLLKTYILV